ncbi:MAG: heavy-metal-associated domain-containing protein [Acidimicrobiales bacterium]
MSTTDVSTVHTILRSEGFSCPSCVSKIEKRVSRVQRRHRGEGAHSSARIEVDHDPTIVTVDELVAVVAKAGYKSVPAAY